MLRTEIFQTLEYRENEAEVERHGPYFCSKCNPDGSLKDGIKEPWLGEGYYFWDTRITDAHWWGNSVYKRKGYIICKTTYDQHSPLLYDLLGVSKHFDEFVECARYILEQRGLKKISVPVVLSYLKNLDTFKYKAIRAWPNPKTYKDIDIKFPGKKMMLGKVDKIQLCFFDKTLLTEPFKIEEKYIFAENQTI